MRTTPMVSRAGRQALLKVSGQPASEPSRARHAQPRLVEVTQPTERRKRPHLVTRRAETDRLRDRDAERQQAARSVIDRARLLNLQARVAIRSEQMAAGIAERACQRAAAARASPSKHSDQPVKKQVRFAKTTDVKHVDDYMKSGPAFLDEENGHPIIGRYRYQWPNPENFVGFPVNWNQDGQTWFDSHPARDPAARTHFGQGKQQRREIVAANLRFDQAYPPM
ncbi:MAG: hypothetical protein M4579_004674 [Chaenotheca gracillima]|nr:MAG: hypothetical protein M4579_004674 [Chaenotheca gracillima]